MESKLILAKYKPFIVAVTGSVGKTSAKDAVYCVLKGRSRFVRKSEKNMNSEFGLPLTVIGAPNAWRDPIGWIRNLWLGLSLILSKADYPDCLILEVGADHPGDIKSVAGWLKPDVVVITRISRTPVHVEFFDSPDQVFEEKAALAGAVKAGGTLVLFADDDKTLSLGERAKDRGVKILSYGMNEGATVRAVDLKAVYSGGGGDRWRVQGGLGAVSNGFEFSPAVARTPAGMSFTAEMGGKGATITVEGILGTGYAYSLLAAAAVGNARGLDLSSAAASLSAFRAPRGRMNIIRGLNGSTLIDDTYNSSPDAAEAALDALKGLECAGARIAVLGDMMELGKYAAEEHRRIGAAAAKAADRLYTVGQRSKLTAGEAVKAGMPPDSVRSFDNAREAAAFLKTAAGQGDVILVKGSQSMRMERVAKAIMAEPEKAAELLARQEKEWLDKE